MDDDAQVPSIVFHEHPSLVDRGHRAVRARDADIAYGRGGVAIDEDGVVGDFTLRPAAKGEALVVRESRIAADEIGQRTSASGAEGLRSHRQGRFEQHGTHLIAVGSVDHPLG